MNQGYDDKAIEYFLQSLKVSEQLGDKKRIATVMINIGALYFNKPATHDKALHYNIEAVKFILKGFGRLSIAFQLCIFTPYGKICA